MVATVSHIPNRFNRTGKSGWCDYMVGSLALVPDKLLPMGMINEQKSKQQTKNAKRNNMTREEKLEQGIWEATKELPAITITSLDDFNVIMKELGDRLLKLKTLIEPKQQFWPGQLVEVRYRDSWMRDYIVADRDNYVLCQRRGTFSYNNIRPAKDPSFSDYIPHDGSGECPVPEGTEVEVFYADTDPPYTGWRDGGDAKMFKWCDVAGYMVLCEGRGDDGNS